MKKKYVIKDINLFVFFLYIVLALLSLMIIKVFEDLPFHSWTKIFCSVAVLLLFVQIYVFRILKIKILSVFPLISLLSYLFQFGDILCYSLGYKKEVIIRYIKSYADINAYTKGVSLAFGCVITFTIGGMLLKLFSSDFDEDIFRTRKIVNTSFYKYLGIILISTTFPLWLYHLIFNAKTIIENGSYEVLLKKSLPGYITSFASFIYIGMFSLMLYFRIKNSKLKMWITISVFVFCLSLFMLLGSRSVPMSIFFAFLIFYNRCLIYKKIRKEHMIILIIGAYILINLLHAIQVSRLSGFSLSDIINEFWRGGLEIVLDEIWEFGITGISTSCIVNNIKEFHPDWFVIKELCSITPIPIVSKYAIVGSVAAGIPELGTSYIGEMYYYYGNWCYLATFFIAIYITSIENCIYKQLSKNNYFIFLMFLMWMWQQLNCIRASFNLALKTMIYSFILLEGVKIICLSFHRSGMYVKKFNYQEGAVDL